MWTSWTDEGRRLERPAGQGAGRLQTGALPAPPRQLGVLDESWISSAMIGPGSMSVPAEDWELWETKSFFSYGTSGLPTVCWALSFGTRDTMTNEREPSPCAQGIFILNGQTGKEYNKISSQHNFRWGWALDKWALLFQALGSWVSWEPSAWKEPGTGRLEEGGRRKSLVGQLGKGGPGDLSDVNKGEDGVTGEQRWAGSWREVVWILF